MKKSSRQPSAVSPQRGGSAIDTRHGAYREIKRLVSLAQTYEEDGAPAGALLRLEEAVEVALRVKRELKQWVARRDRVLLQHMVRGTRGGA